VIAAVTIVVVVAAETIETIVVVDGLLGRTADISVVANVAYSPADPSNP
jgi:hypothetical protein